MKITTVVINAALLMLVLGFTGCKTGVVTNADRDQHPVYHFPGRGGS